MLYLNFSRLHMNLIVIIEFLADSIDFELRGAKSA
jgi:hypothetical protein